MPIERRPLARRDGGYLLAVGRLSPEKGYEDLIRVAGRVPEVRLRIAGIGPVEDRMREAMRSEKVENVELVGYKRGADLAALYDGAAAFIASPVGYENAPLTVLDALGYGLPVLATDIGGLPEMVKDGANGYLIPHGSRDAWITALKRFASLSEDARSRMAEQSRRIAESFPDWDRHVDLIRQVYEGV
jgi:glycosyltransferase involved in cell wall biosynthesis